ncbi:hypothetical protein [Kribbella sp. NPDC023855]|uniref:hypothetical protein n=1 Tax=Kribbella sp. NPDC023855 TaxID=3154698 RepID=UPI0033DB330B
MRTTRVQLDKLGLPFHPRTGLQAVGIVGGKPVWPIVGADGRSANPSPILDRFYKERDECIAFVERTLKEVNDAGRDLSTSEDETLAKYRTRIKELDKQIKPIEDFEQLRGASDQAGARYVPSGGSAGGQPNGATSAGADGHTAARTQARVGDYKTRGQVLVDMCRAADLGHGGHSDVEARDRLLASGVVFPGATDDQVRQARTNAATLRTEARVTQVSGDTPGIIPVPIIGEVMNDVDNARPFISSIGAKPLDFAGETFKRPVVTQHVAMGKQTTQATSTGLGSQKMTIGSVTFTKETWGGWLDVSRQEIDWTSPAAWDAILNDLTDQYGLVTENAAGDAFAAAVTATVEVAGTGAASTLKDWITAIYAGAALAYAGAGRLPDTIWMSLDMWGTLGPLIESQVAMQKNVGDTEAGSFDGNLLRLPRYVVPSFPSGTVIIGAKRWTEVYEERIGLLQAVLPSVLGVQIAYGGYVAFNTLKAAAFAKVVNAA